MTPVEELREAAKVLRQRAEHATAGPWRHEPGARWRLDGNAHTYVETAYATSWHVVALTGEDNDPHPASSPTAAYIATMDPLVGTALAELLEHIADDMGDDSAEEAPIIEHGKLIVRATAPAMNWRWDWTAALALARLILGGEA